MVYATLDQIKKWLMIPSTDTSEDEELNELLNAVDAEIQIIISKYTDSPPESDDVIAMYESLWVAGLYRMRREKVDDVHPYVRYAREKLEEYLKSKFGGGFEAA